MSNVIILYFPDVFAAPILTPVMPRLTVYELFLDVSGFPAPFFVHDMMMERNSRTSSDVFLQNPKVLPFLPCQAS